MSTDGATKNVEDHEAKVAGGEDKLQAQSEQKLDEMSASGKTSNTEKDNEESHPKSAADDQPDDSDPS
jgi:hypothetical protein